MKEMFVIFLLLAIYFLPTAIAIKRDHRNAVPIFFTNLFFSWTGFGWLAVFIWATTANTKKEEIKNYGL